MPNSLTRKPVTHLYCIIQTPTPICIDTQLHLGGFFSDCQQHLLICFNPRRRAQFNFQNTSTCQREPVAHSLSCPLWGIDANRDGSWHNPAAVQPPQTPQWYSQLLPLPVVQCQIDCRTGC